MDCSSTSGTRRTISAGKGLALLVYLSLSPNRRTTRDTLLDILWGDLPAHRARAPLRQLVWWLRQQLGDDVLETDGRWLILGDSVTADHDDFARAISDGDIVRAIEMYTGPFLADFSVPGGDGFDDWAFGERTRLARLHETAAHRRLDELSAAGRFNDAAAVARRLVILDELSESAHRQLVACLSEAAEYDAALLAATELQNMLDREEVTPEPETVQLLRSVRVAEKRKTEVPTSTPTREAVAPFSRLRRRQLALAGIVLVIGVPTILAWYARRPSHLVITTEPLTIDAGDNSLVPVPIVEVRDRRDYRVPGYRDSVTVRLSGAFGTLEGRTVAPVRNGRAAFDELIVSKSPTTFRLEFSAPGLRAVQSALLDQSPETMRLFLVDGTVNGTPVDAQHRTVAVTPGEVVEGALRLRYSVPAAAASVVLGAAPTWGDRTKSTVAIFPLVTPMKNRVISDVRIRVVAPVVPGTYHVIFAFQLEDDVTHVFSGTNWETGGPVWYDGNDVVEWSREKIDSANTFGFVMNDKIYTRGRFAEVLPATAIEIVVLPDGS